MWRGVLLLGLPILAGCSDTTLLVVDLRTDVRAGMEFTGIRDRTGRFQDSPRLRLEPLMFQN